MRAAERPGLWYLWRVPPQPKDDQPAQPKNPLHGVTLADIVEQLVAHMGWEAMGQAVNIRCFTHDPSVKSSLHFLRRTPWARAEVEALYLRVAPAPGSGDDET